MYHVWILENMRATHPLACTKPIHFQSVQICCELANTLGNVLTIEIHLNWHTLSNSSMYHQAYWRFEISRWAIKPYSKHVNGQMKRRGLNYFKEVHGSGHLSSRLFGLIRAISVGLMNRMMTITVTLIIAIGLRGMLETISLWISSGAFGSRSELASYSLTHIKWQLR